MRLFQLEKKDKLEAGKLFHARSLLANSGMKYQNIAQKLDVQNNIITNWELVQMVFERQNAFIYVATSCAFWVVFTIPRF